MWDAYGSCDTITGLKTRTRTCTDPAPRNGGATCPGLDSSESTCSGEAHDSCCLWCNKCIRCLLVDGNWTPWQTWQECAAGTTTRTRACTDPAPLNGGADCVGDAAEQNQSACELTVQRGLRQRWFYSAFFPGEWAQWSEWSCSVTCDYGVKSRMRTCPLGEGQCPGEKAELDHCLLSQCTNPSKGMEAKTFLPKEDVIVVF